MQIEALALAQPKQQQLQVPFYVALPGTQLRAHPVAGVLDKHWNARAGSFTCTAPGACGCKICSCCVGKQCSRNRSTVRSGHQSEAARDAAATQQMGSQSTRAASVTARGADATAHWQAPAGAVAANTTGTRSLRGEERLQHTIEKNVQPMSAPASASAVRAGTVPQRTCLKEHCCQHALAVPLDDVMPLLDQFAAGSSVQAMTSATDSRA